MLMLPGSLNLKNLLNFIWSEILGMYLITEILIYVISINVLLNSHSICLETQSRISIYFNTGNLFLLKLIDTKMIVMWLNGAELLQL